MPDESVGVRYEAIEVEDLAALQPTGDILIVVPDEAPEETTGGLYIPNVTNQLQTGLVVAAGPGRLLGSGMRAPQDVGVGDRVLYPTKGDDAITVADRRGPGGEVRHGEVLSTRDALAVIW